MKEKKKSLRLEQVLCAPFLVFLILLLYRISVGNAQRKHTFIVPGKEKEILSKTGVSIVIFLTILFGIGCSNDGTFESPDTFEVTTLEAVHGQIGHRADVMVSKEGEEIVRQIVLALQDSDVSAAPIYVVTGYTSGAPYAADPNTLVALVPSLPKGTKQKGGITYGGSALLCYLRVTTPSDTLYWSVRSSQETIAKVVEQLAKPPKVLDTKPGTVTEISYYSDSDLTIPLIDETVVGDTIYTKVVFSKEVPIVFADDADARPNISSSVSRRRQRVAAFPYYSPHQPIESQYRMKPRGTNLQSGDAKPYQNTKNTFVCKYIVQKEDVGEVFHTYVGHHETEGDYMYVSFFEHTDEIPEQVGPTITDWQPHDFVGQIYIPSIVDDVSIHFEKQLPGVNVTIMSGPRQGESAVTDRNGRYRFLNVAEDELHLRIKKKYFETKEVIVRRSGPTTLTNGTAPFHRGSNDPQKEPGNILMGQAWLHEIRFLLEEMLVPPDLLYCEGGTPSQYKGISGRYHSDKGVVVIYSDQYWLRSEDRTDWISLLLTFAHEITHAHQHAVSINDNKKIYDWINTPEGRAFQVARERDLAEVGETVYDSFSHFSSTPLENAAETGARYWGGERLSLTNIGREDFPNRFKWAEEWLTKK